MTQKILLKDQLFNPSKVAKLASEITKAYPQFPSSLFISTTLAKFDQLELKARIDHITERLKQYLPSDYPTALQIIINALPAPCDPTLTDNDFGDFIYAPYAVFVAKNGCSKPYLHLSLDALKHITTRFSAEYAIRFFINAFPDATMAVIMTWATDPHYHIRRLASEGTRPKLPWAQKLTLPYHQTLPILNILYKDKTRFVTRSVANHINDISKLNPDMAISTLTLWKSNPHTSQKEMDFIISHSLRTLIKQGHPSALHFLDIPTAPAITVQSFQIDTPTVQLGTSLDFTLSIKALESTSIILNYVIYFQNKRGQLKNKKVFKLKSCTLSKNQILSLKKSHPFKQMTTRLIYPGIHCLALQLNGQQVAEVRFSVIL
jgi:3-methyladenine DNA glycosylase AlkC